MHIDQINALDSETAFELFLQQCHSPFWAKKMHAARPFESAQQTLQKAEEIWHEVSEAEVLEAFKGHAKIGDLQALRDKFAKAEQGQVAVADDALLLELKEQNQRYLDKFGFIFIVCATGKSAKEMLDLLNARIDNTREQELCNGAIEQGKITTIRLKKLLEVHE